MIAPEECPHCGDDNINRDGARWRCERCWNWFGDSRPRAAVTTSPTKPYTNIITMIAMHPFVEAAENKLRFSANGQLSVEDLFDLPLKRLDELALEIDSGLTGTRKSFLTNPDRKATIAQQQDTLRLEVIKHVIETREALNAAKKAATDKQARRAFLERIREKREIDQLESLSLDEIDREIAALDAVEEPATPVAAGA